MLILLTVSNDIAKANGCYSALLYSTVGCFVTA